MLMKTNSKIHWLGTRSAVIPFLMVALGITSLTPAWAAKPPKPPPAATSTIYFIVPDNSNNIEEIWKMNPDGSGKTQVLVLPRIGEDEGYLPSKARHGGRRWFLLLRDVGGSYPNLPGDTGYPRRELFAISDQGEAVQLTDDPSFQPNEPVMGKAMLCWTIGTLGVADSRITMVGRRWNTDGTAITEAGLFAIDLNPETLAANSGENLRFSPTRMPVPLEVSLDYDTYGDVALVSGYDWSPDGMQLVYSQDGILFIAGLAGGNPQVLVSDPTPDAHHPKWSPILVGGQAQILFTTGSGGWQIALERINLDGTGRITVVPPYTNVKIFRYPDSTLWSPAGAYVLYAEYDSGFGVPWKKAQCDIIRVTPSGSSRTSLTGDTSPAWCYPVGWAAE